MADVGDIVLQIQPVHAAIRGNGLDQRFEIRANAFPTLSMAAMGSVVRASSAARRQLPNPAEIDFEQRRPGSGSVGDAEVRAKVVRDLVEPAGLSPHQPDFQFHDRELRLSGLGS